MKKLLTIILIWFSMTSGISAQNVIKGSFLPLTGKQVHLVGFSAFGTYTIDSTMVSPQGEFTLNYAAKDKGLGYLTTADNKPYIVMLAGELISLKGQYFTGHGNVSILTGNQQKLFVQYTAEHVKREQAQSAWLFLQEKYSKDSFFAQQTSTKQAINSEVERLTNEESSFINGLNPQSYISWYLPVRNWISSVSEVAKLRPNEIPATIAAFRNLNFADNRFIKSGLFRNAVESHFWLLQNSRQVPDAVYQQMQISIDAMLKTLANNEKVYNETTKYLFELFEKHSQFKASEYLAIKALSNSSCSVNPKLANKLELYRVMKKGNTASDFVLSGDVYSKGIKQEVTMPLSDIQTDYKLVIFGASWCKKCTEELKQLLGYYQNWKLKGVEVVFVSLDTKPKAYNAFASKLPFISMCDYLKWESQAVKDYYVFATPTMFLLDANQKIVLRPNSIDHLNAWIN